MSRAHGRLTVVIPCYNEERVLPLLRERLQAVLGELGVDWDVVCVDDGSRDATFEVLRQLHELDPRFRVVGLSRNFGHQAAVCAGLHYATGDAVAVMDADLQDPPELLRECVSRWREGYDVVYAVRRYRPEGLWKRASYATFYRLLRVIADIDIPLDSGDFCLMDRCVVDVLRAMPERSVFVRGMRAWAGFRQVAIPYDRAERAAGQSKYPLRRLVRLALDGLLSFSTMPLRLASWFGLGIVGLCVVLIVFVSGWRVAGAEFMGHTPKDIPGWAAVMVSSLFLGGVQLLMLGVIGEYLARIYDEVKARPRWVVGRALGLERRSGGVE